MIDSIDSVGSTEEDEACDQSGVFDESSYCPPWMVSSFSCVPERERIAINDITQDRYREVCVCVGGGLSLIHI